MRKLCVILTLSLAAVASAQSPSPAGSPAPASPAANHPSVQDVLTSALVNVSGTPLKVRYNDPTDFGTAFKASVLPLINKADNENPPVAVSPWMPISGSKVFMTWKKDDNKYFTGDRLFADVGQKVFGLTVGIDTQVDTSDASMGTYRDYYGGRYNHLQSPMPASIATPLPDNQITSASIGNVLEVFPWKNPTDPTTAITQAQFDGMKSVYYGYKKDHLTIPYASLILPFAVPNLLAPGSGPLITMDQVVSNYAALGSGARPVFKVADGLYDDLGGFWNVNGKKYTFQVQYDYYFQEVPSRLDIDQNGVAAGAAPVSLRNTLNDFDGPMALFNPGPNNTPAVFQTPNGDNTIFNDPANNRSLREVTNGQADASWLDTLANTPVPAGFDPSRPNQYAPGYQVNYFKKVSTQTFSISKADLENLNTDPSQSRLAVSYSVHPTVAFSPQHFADEADASPNDMAVALRNASPPVPIKKMRQGSMQVYVAATAHVFENSSAVTGNGTEVASYKVIDDNYILTPYVKDPYKTLADLNAVIASGGIRGGTYVKNGDPYDRVPDFQRTIIPTPARVDTTLTQAAPEDRLMAYFPDPRRNEGKNFLAAVRGKEGPPERGNPNSLGNAYFEAHVGRGPAYNYVFDRDGAPIDPTRAEPPAKYWANPRHVAIVFPWRVSGNGIDTTVGPYVLDLNHVHKSYVDNGSQDQYYYRYAEFPWHDKDNTDNDKCIPIVLADPLRSAINKLIDSAGTVDVHMTAEASAQWGKPLLPGNTPDYRYAAALSTVDSDKKRTDSLILRVPCSDENEALIPNPGSFVPLMPSFPTFEGRLPDGIKQTLNPQLTVCSDGTPQKPDQYFVGSFDARLRTQGPQITQSVPVPGLAAEAREILSRESVDQTIKAQVVDGCGRISTLASEKVASVPLFRPSASVTFVPTDNPAGAYTVGVPIAQKYFIPGNEAARPFPAPSALSLGSRISDLNRPLLAGNLSEVFDGTEAPGTDKNPGDEFFRPPDATQQRVVKGRSVRMEIVAESQIQPGFDIYDIDNPDLGGNRTKFQNTYASFVRRIDLSVYPPGSAAGPNDAPEKKTNLFFFNTATDISGTVAPPPMATFEYVFREATDASPQAKGKLPDTDRHYLVRLDLEDMAGNTRAMKIPVWVTDEGVSTDKLSTEHQRK